MALTTGKRSFGERVSGVLRLEPSVFREIGRDVDATGQAMLVVALAAVANGIGNERSGLTGIVFGIVSAVLGWIVFSAAAWLVGKTVAPDAGYVTPGRVFRLIGFAQAPKLIGLLGFLPLVGWIFGGLAAVLFLVVAIFALKSAFDTDLPRAILIGAVAIIVTEVVLLLLGAVLGLGQAILGGFASLLGHLF